MTAVGALRQRLVLEAPSETADDGGGVVRTWTTLDEVWAAISPLDAEVKVAADRAVPVRRHQVTIRRRDDITPRHRFRLGDRVLAIRTLRDPDERGRFLECITEEEAP